MKETREFFLITLWRYVATYTGYVIFGVGALGLMFVGFPVLRLVHKDKREQFLASRRLTSRAFRFFVLYVCFSGAADINLEKIRATPLPKTGAIIVANHPTLLDYVFIASVLTEVDCVVRTTLLKNPFLGPIIRACGYLTNDDPDAIFEECRKRFANGDTLLIFPEGTRSIPGTEMKLRRGAAQLAIRCNVPLQVIHIDCSEWWLGKQLPWYSIPHNKPRLTLSFVETIEPEHFTNSGKTITAQAARRLTEHLHFRLTTIKPTENHHGLT